MRLRSAFAFAVAVAVACADAVVFVFAEVDDVVCECVVAVDESSLFSMEMGVAGGDVRGEPSVVSAEFSTVCGDIGSGVFAPLDSARLSVRRFARDRPPVNGNFM